MKLSIDQIMHILEEDELLEFYPAEVARRYGVSLRQLREKFLKYTGKTPQQIRSELITDLVLRNIGHHSLQEIADELEMTPQAVSYHLNKNGIKLQRGGDRHSTKWRTIFFNQRKQIKRVMKL